MAKIKICGLTRVEDIYFVNEAKPDYIGFVFAASKRRVSLEQASRLKSLLAEEIKAVGVFVNEDIGFIEKVCRENVIDIIQLHGDEDEKYLETLKSILKNSIIKAVRVGKKEDIICPSLTAAKNPASIGGSSSGAKLGISATKIQRELKLPLNQVLLYPDADYVLFDTYHKGQYGGTGETFDWELVKNYEKPFFLAGGIDLDNIKSAMEKVRPYCLDVSSGAETDGKKDREKIIKIVNTARGGN